MAAYGEIGFDTGSFSVKGNLLLAPYTDDDEAKTKLVSSIPADLAASRTLSVPPQFTSSYKSGASIEGLTPALAAK